MPLPANRVDTVRVPNDTTTYDIVPSSLQDGSGKHSIATPTTTKDTTLVVGVKINNVTKEPTNGIVDLGTFQDGLDGDQLAAVNSGITADKVTKYEGYETKINSNTSEIGIIKDVLKSGVTFKGKITDPTLPAATDYNNGDLIIFGEKEYICFDNGTSKEWIELGDEGTHLTKAMADTYYVEKNDGITGATKCKITYDAKGLVTKGENLSASDIPSLDAGKITTGKFADERIASAATWNAKQDAITSSNKLDASLVSGLSTVATSGNYDDLSNKPAVENLVPYTGATKNINLGGHRITTARKTLTDNDTQVQLTPDWISLINPGYGVSISADSIRVKDRVLEWPSAEGQRDTFATIGDITTKVSGFVPYEGATKDVNIGNHGILMGEPTGTLLTLDPSTIMFSLGGESQDMLYIDARTVTILNDNAGDSIYWPGAIGSTTPGAKVFALTSDITSHAGIDKVGTVTSVNGTSPDSNGNVNVNIPVTSDWEFLGKVAEKTFSKAFTEVKPGKSGIPSGNATVNVTATTYQKKVEGAIVGYKTIVDVTCRCEQFNLNDVGLNVLLSKVGSKWFMPRMAIGKGNMASTAFNTMMDKLNAQKDNVGISVDEVVVFKDNRGVSGNPGTLNVSGITNGQVVYDASEFRVFAVMLELDKDNEGKAIPCTGAHYRIVLYHPETIL